MSSPTTPGITPESNARDIAALTSAVDMLVSQFIRPATQQANANREALDEVIDILSRHAQGLLSMEQRLDQMVDRLESIEGIVAQNAQQIAETVQQQRVNTQQIAEVVQQQRVNAQQIAEVVQQQRVNAQQIAEVVQQQRVNAQQIAETVQQQRVNAQQIAEVVQQQRANAQQIAQNAEAIIAFDQRLEETRQLVAKNSSDFARMSTETKAGIDHLVEENRAFREENRIFREESRAFRESQQSQLAAIIGNARRIDRLEQQAS